MSSRPSPIHVPATDLIANVFDAVPIPAFVVDRNFYILDFNLAAAKLLDRVPFALFQLRGDHQLQCIHSAGADEQASSEPCPECKVKNFVSGAFGTVETRRSAFRLQLTRGGAVDCLVTVSPIADEAEPLALLLLEECSDLARFFPAAGKATASSSPNSKAPAKAPGRKKGNS